jgi:type 1 fimbriae regulatory protein FimB/type 1 fimbriae regulatory protein FimE
VPNHTLRSREYLTEDEVRDLIKAARSVGRNRLRDATLILVSYRHGLRVSEATDLRWEQVDFRHEVLHVRRIKNGTASTRAIQAYLGHRNINHTVRYTELSPERFRGFWKD